MTEHPHHDDEFVLFAGNIGCNVAGRAGHSFMVSPFFELPPSGAAQLPLFNGMTAFLCFAVFSKATSMASTTTVLGGDGVFCVPGPGTTLRDQLDRKVLNDGGTPSGQLHAWKSRFPQIMETNSDY